MKRNSVSLLIGFLLVVMTACIPQNRMEQEWKIKAINNETFSILNQIFDAEGNSILACYNDHEWSETGRIIKISRNGETMWSVDLPAKMTVASDMNGYLYAVGQKKEASETGTVYRAVLAKYNQDGEQVWIIFDAPGIGFINLSGLSIDRNQDIIVSGQYGVSKFDPDGELLWSNEFPIKKMTTDTSGDIYAIGGAVLRKISGTDGELIWKNEIENSDAENNFCYLRGLATDSHGNVIVLGSMGKSIDNISSYPERVNGHSFLIKYAQDGSQLWEQIYPNPESATAIWTYADSSDITVDSQDNIIATLEGTLCNLYIPVPNPIIWTTIWIAGVGSTHAEVAKYNTEGILLWKLNADSGGINSPMLGKLHVDRLDGIYLDSSNRLFHYDPDGILVWSLIKSPLELGTLDHSRSVVDIDGNPYLFASYDTHNSYLARYKHVSVLVGE